MKLAQCIVATCLSVLLSLQGLSSSMTAYAVTLMEGQASGDQYATSAASLYGEDEDAAAGSGSDAGSGDSGYGTDADDEGALALADDSETEIDGSATEGYSTIEDAESDERDDVDDDVALASITYEYTTISELNVALSGHGSATGSGDNVEITYEDNDALKIISHADPRLYENATIKRGGSTGSEFDVSATTGEAASFQGFGSTEHPFAGTLVNGGEVLELTSDRTVFNALKVTDGYLVKIIWKGATDYNAPMVATELSGSGTLGVSVKIADPNTADTDFTDASPALTAPLFGTVKTGGETVEVNAEYSFTGARKALSVSASGNIGLLANIVESGTLAIGGVTGLDGLNDNGAIATSKGNAGLLIGQVNDGATVSMGAFTLGKNVTVSSASGSAGGLAGQVGSSDGATVTLTGAVDFTKLTAQGTTASGGLIGKAAKLILNQTNAPFTCPNTVGSNSSENTGGFIGSVSFSGDKAFTANDEIVTSSAVQLESARNAGAVFGYLDLRYGDVTFTAADAASPSVFSSTMAGATSATVYGGIVGRVEDTGVSGSANSSYSSTHSLAVKNVKVEGTCTQTPKTAGGLVGSLGTSSPYYCATLIVDGATVAWGGPWVSFSFGGVVGNLDNYSVLDCGDVTVSTQGDVSKGAGIAGETWKGTIRLRGTTDLSGLRLSSNASGEAAQIAITSYNWPSLIFATGSGSDENWTLKRCDAVAADDLGGNGTVNQTLLGHNEVVRLGGEGGLSSHLIQLDDTTHQPRFLLPENSPNAAAATSSGDQWGRQLGFGSSTVNVASVDEFACLALTIQTLGYFSGVSGIDNRNINTLKKSTINIDGDIDLSGTGITGLTQDAYYGSYDRYSSWVYSGTLNGNGHTVTLAVGEPYGTRNGTVLGPDDTSEGNGKIYYHNRLGLLGEVSDAAVNSLTITGTMNLDARTPRNSEKRTDVGAVAARVNGSTTIGADNDVKATVAITYGNQTNASNSIVSVGGLIGRVAAASTVTLGGAGTSCFAGSIASGTAEAGNSNVGGIIGRVDDTRTTVNATKASVSGSISTQGSSAYAAVGGFIGVIGQGGNKKTVNITNLDLSGLKIAREANDKSETAGGLLGHSWGNVYVNFSGSAGDYALKTGGTTLTANNATQVGGLVYASSGVWSVGDRGIDLSGATMSANSATKLGLLVCMGGDNVRVGDQNYAYNDTMGGLYLKNTADWNTAYKVNESAGAIVAGSVVTFDEWVADTCMPGFDVTATGVNGVVSLHTTGDKLDMSGAAGSRNSYVNRTALGKAHQTNGSSRYYYNLDRMGSYTLGGTVDTPAKLLLWSVYHYAAGAINGNFASVDADAASSSTAITGDLDMDGYSYYPVDVKGESIAVSDATITFHNSRIESEENGNKLTSAETQHMNMHAGLLRNFTAGTDTSTEYSYSVSNVTLKGSVGTLLYKGAVVGAGALLAGTMTGDEESARIATLGINGLALDGLTVRGVEDVSLAPLAACNFGSYSALNVTGVSAKNYASGTAAATSLFGNLGNESADQVTASFTNIAVPSLASGDGKDAIFTRASLLESYAFAQGKASSATYTFTKADDAAKQVTYGKEIDSDGEYHGKQFWYYDESLNGVDAGLVTDGTRTANATTPQYGAYLPYVAKGQSGSAYHEIKVNQRIANLTSGCGTYGDPYSITTPGQLYAVAYYINTGAAQDEWAVTVTRNQEQICSRRSDGSTDNEITYLYSASDRTWKEAAKINEEWTAKESGETLEDATMRRYIQSCYLSIETDGLEVDTSSFNGLGTHDYPFRGVIVGNLDNGASSTEAGDDASGDTAVASSRKTLVIKNSVSNFQGLIPYSYGSVVRDLNVQYAGAANTIAYTAKNATDGVPTAFFGGVIGCVMGGDNIIDGVVVSAGSDSDSGEAASEASENLLTRIWNALTAFVALVTNSASSQSFGVSASGDKSHLVAIGGYVGAISGGGVIFRSMSDDACKWRESSANLYDNPYVGRVIDGFAFSEGCEIDNGDDNYKINELDTALTNCVETSSIQGKYSRDTNSAANVTVNNAQGLLVLSSIINSGAASGASNTDYEPTHYGVFRGSRAYQGNVEHYPASSTNGYRFGNKQFGKVRNADYSGVGSVSAIDDFNTAKNDDLYAPGKIGDNIWQGPLDDLDSGTLNFNSPYLVGAYANAQTGYVCASGLSGINLEFASNSSYDMTEYGAGFLGLSGRYYSNACYSGMKSTDRDRIIPWIACINGNNSTFTLSSAAQEYQDDDYSVAGVGGLFSTITFTSSSVGDTLSASGANVKNINFKNCNVSLTYLDSSNNKLSNYAKSNTGVGIIAGVTANANSQASYGVYKNVVITADDTAGTSVSGAENAGGFYGSAGYAQRSGSSSVDEIVSFSSQCAPIKLYDCSYSKLSVTGRTNVGGYVGKIASGESGLWATSGDYTFASNSTIAIDSKSTDNTNAAGGIFGLVGCSVNVNTGQEESAEQLAVMSDVKVTTTCAASRTDEGCTRGVGSLVGRAEGVVTANRLKVTASTEAATDAPIYLGSLNESQNNLSNTAAKNVGGIVGWSNKNVSINGSTVEKLRIGNGEHSGGVVGTLDGGVTLAVDGSAVNGMVFDGARNGGIVGNVNNSGANVNVANTTIQGCSFSGKASYWKSHPGGNGNFSGGIVGYALGTYRVSNILLSENTFSDVEKRQGLLVGCTAQDSGNFKGVYAAGIKVKLASNQTNADVPAAICYFRESSDKSVINQKSYIAFANYTDSADGTAGLFAAAGASPYVTTSPMTSVKVSADSGSGFLFGDGAAITTAATIKDQAGTSVAGRYTYTNIGGIDANGSYQNTNDYKASISASTFNDNNSTAKADTDFNVLLLPGNDTTTVANYLNLVTNGGFSDAVRLNGSTTHVSATVQTVKLENDSLVASDDTPTVRVVNNGTTSMSFRATSQWDNEKGRFTLLTLTFSEAGQEYKVQVPIIVRRMLEVDFTATYSYGTHFTPDAYSSLGENAHVLTNFGEPMSGYLTWTYNRGKGEATEYGWDTHLASGGAMGALGKHLEFSGAGEGAGALPAGTQLTLVDTAHGDKAYSYTVSTDGSESVGLGDFTDSAGKKYQELWLSEIMGVSAAQDTAGAWVQCDAGDPSVGAKVVTGNETHYYRPYAAASDSGADRYTLTVAKGPDGKETTPSENFYLVVNVPSGKTAAAVNGYTGTSFTDTSVNKTINYTLRSDASMLDGHQNTASTYSIYSSYDQSLEDSTGKSGINELPKTDDYTGYTFPLAATDTIRFDSSQQYNDSDKLYYQFGASLVSYIQDGDSSASSTGAVGFPTGTTGTLSFYVKVGDVYYTPTTVNGKTTWTAAAAGTPAATKAWSADGNDLAESLADGNGNLYDLSPLRKTAGSDGAIQISVEVDDLKMSEEAAKQAIAASQNGESYTMAHYRSALSTRTETLSTSNMVVSVQGAPGYYRKDLGSSTIELTASKQTQLGINVDDLDLADGTIGAVGTYSLLKLSDGGDELMKSAAKVKYTLTLQRRASADGAYEDVNINDYLGIKSSALGTGAVAKDGSSVTFIDVKSDGAFATRDGDTNAFKLLFEVKVKTDVEAEKHIYANYRIVLKAELLGVKDDTIDTPVNAGGVTDYNGSDYITYSLTRVNTNGISH